MILEETIHRLVELKLHAMATMLRELSASPAKEHLSTEDLVGMLVDLEWTARENKRLGRLLKDARVPGGACLEELSCEAGRGVDKSFARTLGSCSWVRATHNVIVVGATGAGKSFLGGALAQAACRQGFRALWIRTPRLLQQLAVACADGTYVQALARLAKVSVLVRRLPAGADDRRRAPRSARGPRGSLRQVLDGDHVAAADQDLAPGDRGGRPR